MRIVHVARRMATAKWGGVEEYVVNLSREQQRLGHDVEIFATAALHGPQDDRVLDSVKYFPYRYPFLLLNEKEKESLDDFGGDPQSTAMLKELEATGADVLHLHTASLLVLPLIRWAQKQKRCRIVMSMHSGVGIPNVHAAVSGWSHLSYRRVLNFFYKRKKRMKSIDAFLCVNEQDIVLLKEKNEAKKAFYIPPFVNPLFFSEIKSTRSELREKYGFPNSLALWLMVGRVHPLKNQLGVLKSLVHVPEACLLIVGPEVDPAYSQELKDFILNNNLSHRVKFLGPLDPFSIERVEVLKAADLFVFPSIYDSFGIVVVEAWATKCLVVSAPLEQWSHYDTQAQPLFICDFSDTHNAAKELRKIGALPTQDKQQVIDRAYALVQEQFNLKHHTLEIQKVYESL